MFRLTDGLIQHVHMLIHAVVYRIKWIKTTGIGPLNTPFSYTLVFAQRRFSACYTGGRFAVFHFVCVQTFFLSYFCELLSFSSSELYMS